MLDEEIVQAECDMKNFSFKNTTRCGCTSCDDIEVTVQVTVVSVKDSTPIQAAHADILRTDSMELIGITSNNGQFASISKTSKNITIMVQAPNFLTRRTVDIELLQEWSGLSSNYSYSIPESTSGAASRYWWIRSDCTTWPS